jgi:hypothetical protein
MESMTRGNKIAKCINNYVSNKRFSSDLLKTIPQQHHYMINAAYEPLQKNSLLKYVEYKETQDTGYNFIVTYIPPNNVRKTDGRGNNDKNGKTREHNTLKVLQTYTIGKRFEPTLLESIPKEYHSLITCMYNCIPEGALVTAVEKKGGRSFNYDLMLHYTLNDIPSWVKLEIKGGKGTYNIETCPQILSLSEKDPTFLTSDKCYAEWYYNTHLTHFNSLLDEPFDGKFPTLDVYLKYVYSAKYNSHPWFVHAKDRSPQYSPPSNFVNDSIEEFLTDRLYKFDILKIIEKVRSTQLGKIFLLKNTMTGKWSHDQFEDSDFDIGDTPPKVYLNDIKGRAESVNTLIIELPNLIIKCLLRWKNHKGVMYPAYQIKADRRR